MQERRRADVLDVYERSGLEVVDADHAVLSPQQLFAEMGSEKAGTTRNQAGRHRR
jgi:hypothetical protein